MEICSEVLGARAFRMVSWMLRLLIIKQLLNPYSSTEQIGNPSAANSLGKFISREDLAGIALGTDKVNE